MIQYAAMQFDKRWWRNNEDDEGEDTDGDNDGDNRDDNGDNDGDNRNDDGMLDILDT